MEESALCTTQLDIDRVDRTVNEGEGEERKSRERTSVLENRSVSTYSLTPISCKLVSANAIPTVLTLSLTCSFNARITGAASKSVFVKSRSSTALKFPGLALFPNFHFVVPFPPPAPFSASQISILSCFVVKASRRKVCATA